MNAKEDSRPVLPRDEREEPLHADTDDRGPMPRHVHHERTFGIGYGNSSGYGSVLHFTDGHADALFRFR